MSEIIDLPPTRLAGELRNIGKSLQEGGENELALICRLSAANVELVPKLAERLKEAERLITELDNHEGTENWSSKLTADIMMFWASKNS